MTFTPVCRLSGSDLHAFHHDVGFERGIYAVAAGPRVARDSDGSPQVSLILYGKRASGLFEPLCLQLEAILGNWPSVDYREHGVHGAGGRELFYVAPDNKLMAVDLKLTADAVRASEARALF